MLISVFSDSVDLNLFGITTILSLFLKIRLSQFFLDLAENTGDNVFYVILPVNKYCNIPLHPNSVTLVRSVVRSRCIVSSDAQSCIKSPKGFTFYNTHKEDVIDPKETKL